MRERFFMELASKEATKLNIALSPVIGFLEDVDSVTMNYSAFGTSFSIAMTQNIVRTITVTSESPTQAHNLWAVLHVVLRLCMLFEGEFLQIQSIMFFYNEEKTAWSDDLAQEYHRRALPMYSSADFVRGSSEFTCSFTYLSNDLLLKWTTIEDEMEIIHPMVLYGMSSVDVPVELKTTIITESFEPLFELIKKYHPGLEIAPKMEKRPGEKDSKLRRILESVILSYGSDIFQKEINKDVHSFCQVLVYSRNRIFHIKTMFSKPHLAKDEAILYAVKLSALYRRVLLDLLGINYALYKDSLTKIINRWNTWNGVLDFFLATDWTG